MKVGSDRNWVQLGAVVVGVCSLCLRNHAGVFFGSTSKRHGGTRVGGHEGRNSSRVWSGRLSVVGVCFCPRIKEILGTTLLVLLLPTKLLLGFGSWHHIILVHGSRCFIIRRAFSSAKIAFGETSSR